MSDTPRTDAALERGDYKKKKTCISPDFARTLERELNELRTAWQEQTILRQKMEKERDQLRAELVEIKSELALSTKTDDEKPIVTIRGLESLIEELRAEVERLSVHKMARRVDSQNHQESIKELSERCDQWREVAIQLSESLPKESWRRSVTQDNALSAYERLCKEGK